MNAASRTWSPHQVLSTLSQLQSFSLLPSCDDDGLHDHHVAGLSRWTCPNLRCLELRGSLDHLSDEGVRAMAAATALCGVTHLSIMPLGVCVHREGVNCAG